MNNGGIILDVYSKLKVIYKDGIAFSSDMNNLGQIEPYLVALPTPKYSRNSFELLKSKTLLLETMH